MAVALSTTSLGILNYVVPAEMANVVVAVVVSCYGFHGFHTKTDAGGSHQNIKDLISYVAATSVTYCTRYDAIPLFTTGTPQIVVFAPSLMFWPLLQQCVGDLELSWLLVMFLFVQSV
jgi:hypothetical protein